MLLDRIRQSLIFLAGFVLPQEHLNLAIGGLGGAITPNKIAAGLLLVYAAVHWAVRGSSLPRSSKHIWVLFFFVSVGVSALGSLVQRTELRALFGVSITWFSLLLFYWTLSYVTTTRKDVDLLFKGLAFGTVIVVFSAIAGVGNAVETRYGMRAGGVGGNPNMLAFNLVVGIPMFAVYLLAARRMIPRAFYAGAIAVALAGIVVSLSRSGFLGLAAMGVFYMARTRRVQYVLPMIAVVIVFLLLVPETWFERIGTISADPQDKSASNRLEMIPAIFDAFFSSPLVGIGLLRWVAFTFEGGYGVHNVIHNSFFQVMAEQGLLGLVPFIALHVLAWRDLGRSYRLGRRLRRHKDEELTALSLRAGMLQIGCLGAGIISLFAPTQAHKALWMIFAVSTILWQLTRRRAEAVLAEAGELPGVGARAAAQTTRPGEMLPGSARA